MDIEAVAERVSFVQATLNQTHFAGFCDLHQSTVSKLTNANLTQISAIERHCLKISKATGFSYDWLIKGHLPMFTHQIETDTLSVDLQEIYKRLPQCDPAFVRAVRYLVQAHYKK